MRALLPLVALAIGCGSNNLAPRVQENAAETARVSREVEELRRRVSALEGGGGAGAATPGSARAIAAEAIADGLAAYVSASRALAPADATRLEGVWKSEHEALHLAAGGRLCGWRLVDGERRSFRGTWRTRGALLVELHDRWVGDHTELDAVVRDVGAQKDDAFTLSPGAAAFARAPESEWESLASLRPDRAERFAGLPEWCLKRP